jgi:hypothetical protein
MSQKPQSFDNHVRFDPLFHFVASPLLLIGLMAALVNAIALGGKYTHWVIVVIGAGALVACTLVRLRGLMVQNRVIRLEVALRFERQAGRPFDDLLSKLTMPQIVALRFASDGELVDLAERAVRENLPSVEIKRAIRDWRPDHYRI